ncbi:MAG: transposase [Bacteroidota bacterium]
MTQVNRLSFAGQNIYCGIDVHKKSWSVNIRNDDFELRAFSQPPKPEILVDYLTRNYPDATYYAVYEAGFSGFWAQRFLSQHGVVCKVIHPADVPSTDKERQQKTDKVDCRKLSLSLKEGRMEGIYIPSEQQIDDRSILRTRQQLVKDQTRYKNRICSMLDFCGIVIPEGYKNSSHFSKRFMAWLAALNLSEGAKVSLELKLESLKGIRAQLLIANRHVNKLGKGEQYKNR